MIHLRGWLKTVDKYKKAHLLFISCYDNLDFADDFTRNYLQNYNDKFKEKNADLEVSEDIDQTLLKHPLKGDEFLVQLSNKTRYYDRLSNRVQVNDIMYERVLCTCTIIPYKFYKTVDDKKQQIIGWKIMCSEIKRPSI